MYHVRPGAHAAAALFGTKVRGHAVKTLAANAIISINITRSVWILVLGNGNARVREFPKAEFQILPSQGVQKIGGPAIACTCIPHHQRYVFSRTP